jgi:hypothetical protein
MAFKPVPHGVKVAIRGHSNADNTSIVFTMHAKGGGAGPYTLPQLAEVATTVRGAFNSRFVPLLASDYNGDDVTATDLTSSTAGQQTVSNSGIVGGVGAEALPLGVGIVVKWLTASRGRAYRGRTYFAPVPFSDTKNGDHDKLTAAAITAFNTAAASFISDVSGHAWATETFGMAVASIRAAVDVTEGFVTLIDAGVTNPIVGFQRRRRS